ncbi:M91 family zinc metallopeptidase [Mesorhizobium sp. A556]
MPIVSNKLPEFPGFAVRYDSSTKPFFQSMVLEDLRRINSKPIGEKLLEDIAVARPRARTAGAASNTEAQAIVFEAGVNVVTVPTSMEYTQSGYKMGFTGVGVLKSLKPSTAASHNIKDCPYHPAGGSCAQAADITAAGNGTGSVSIMKYTNAQILTGKGEATYSFVVLAHELIHSLHHLTGTRRDNVEEDWTTGIGVYAAEPMTENAVRAAFGLKLREKY